MVKMDSTTFQFSDFENALNQAIHRAIKELVNPVKLQDKDLLSRKETAKKLSISLPTLHLFTKEGIIRAYRIGNRVLYKQEDINNALKIIVPPSERSRNGK